MNQRIRQHAETIIHEALRAVRPDQAVERALEGWHAPGDVYLLAVGKAAWQMADTAIRCLGGAIRRGMVITKYRHVPRPLPGIACYEAGHPVPDEASFEATRAALAMTAELQPGDTVLFLLSGGGSALMELPTVDAQELQDVTRQLLACGADIVEINTIRKRLSQVKGGRFAAWCAPARVHTIVLSDILGDPLDMIASGPTVPDTSTCADAVRIAEKYRLRLSAKAMQCLRDETPKDLPNASAQVIGSVRELCRAADAACRSLGYETVFLTDCMDCEAREAGRMLASVLRSHARDARRLAFLAGGETVVHLTGHGLGGRNQELALAAAQGIDGLSRAAVFSVGSDGTDGPTDAAGGYVDGDSLGALTAKGLSLSAVLEDNDAYHALKAIDGLIVTGPTGTNVNDIAVALLG